VIPFFFAQACSVLKNTQSELGAKRRSFGFMAVAFGRLVVPLCIFDLESVDDAPKLLLRGYFTGSVFNWCKIVCAQKNAPKK
jgi:hypothetical protein